MSEHLTVYADAEHDDVADTMALLENLGISYTLVDLTQDENALQHVEELGFTQTPIVEAGTTSWAGFRPDLIHALAWPSPKASSTTSPPTRWTLSAATAASSPAPHHPVATQPNSTGGEETMSTRTITGNPAVNLEQRQRAVAVELAEVARTLAHSTRKVPVPSESYSMLGELTATLADLEQVCRQLAAWHERVIDGAHSANGVVRWFDSANQAAK